MVYTVEEVAKLLKVSVATVRRLIKIGELEAFPVGNQYRITQEALNNYMSRRAAQ
jgi:excisionase family DNA binding protein